MPRLDNEVIIKRVLLSAIDTIGRRTSEAYAIVAISRIVKQLGAKYDFFKCIEIKNTVYLEIREAIAIKTDINYVDQNEMGKAIKEFFEILTISMEKSAGYYFIKEIKENFPYDFELTIRGLGIDLDVMQLEYITGKKKIYESRKENSDVIKYVLTALFDILDSAIGRNLAFSTMSDIVKRFSIEYDILKYVKINDVRFVRNVDTVFVATEVNAVEQEKVGGLIQKILQEANKVLGEKGGSFFIEKLRTRLRADYVLTLEEMGVNPYVIQLRQELVVKQVLKALADTLSESSSQSYAILAIDSAMKKIDEKYEYLKYVKIDNTRYSNGMDAISVMSEVDSVRPSELGRMIQKIVERVTMALGEDAGRNFVDRFKDNLGKTYLLRIEEMGVNLHMIQLKQNLLW